MKNKKDFTVTVINNHTVRIIKTDYDRYRGNFATLLEVSTQNDYDQKNGLLHWKKEYRSDNIDYSYRLLRYENDNLANWQSLDHAINYVGENAIIEAKRQLNRNLRQYNASLKLARLNPLYLQLKTIADNKLKHYTSDFKFHDCMSIADNNKPFIWFIRDTGTWFINNANDWNNELIKNQLKNNDHDCYLCNPIDNTIVKLDNSQLMEVYNKFN